MREKIILGTVQLGLPYGINNDTGKPSQLEAFRILDRAYDNGIDTLDSADGYGEALDVIGMYMTSSRRTFKVINKFKVDELPLGKKLEKNLELLRVPSLYCYMYHQFSDYSEGRGKEELGELKRKGLISSVGVSLYSTHQLRKVIDDSSVDIIQIPVNILDLNPEKELLIKIAKERGKQIHARSVYLQGLFIKDSDTLTGNLIRIKPYLAKLKSISNQYRIDLKKAALNFVIHKPYIDHVVLGIDNVNQLEENFQLIDINWSDEFFKPMELASQDEFLLNPSNWKL